MKRILLSFAIALFALTAFAQGPGPTLPPGVTEPANPWGSKEAGLQFNGPTMTAYKAALAKMTYDELTVERAKVLAAAKAAAPGSQAYAEATTKEAAIRDAMNKLKPDPTRGPTVAPRS